MRSLVSRLICLTAVLALGACGEAISPTAPMAPTDSFELSGRDMEFSSTASDVDVMLDIRPLMCPNRITRFPWGTLRAAIVGTDALDLADIDISSIRLEGVPAVRNHIRDITQPSNCCGGSQEPAAIRINAGGPALAGDWLEDSDANPSPYRNTGFASSTTETIDMSHPSIPAGTPMEVFQSERWDYTAAPEMIWEIPVSDGTHTVRLYFAESYSRNFVVGARIFDVYVEGDLVLDDYDIYADAGAGHAGVVQEFTTTVSDGFVTINFGHDAIENPLICGIEVLTEGDAPATATTATCGPTPGPDGTDDLILAFRKRAILRAIGPVERGDELELTITGTLLDGTPFSDSDCIIIGLRR